MLVLDKLPYSEGIHLGDTVECCYNLVNFFQNPHNSSPVRPRYEVFVMIIIWFTSATVITVSYIMSRWIKSLANRITSDPKIVIHGNECIILFLTHYFMSWTHNSAKNNHRSLISQLSPRTVVSDLALWRHHSGSVTSREIPALWRHICRLYSHAQIGAKVIFTSE